MKTRTKFKVVQIGPTVPAGATDVRLSGVPEDGKTKMDTYRLASMNLRLNDGQPELVDLALGNTVYSDLSSTTSPPPVPPPTPPPVKGYLFGARLDAYAAGIKPTNLPAIDAATRLQYERWKAALLTGLGGRYPSFQHARRVVSEGIGYGMLIAVVMADRPLFDDLFRVAKTHPCINVARPAGGMNEPALMNWRIEEGKDPDATGGGWNALDGDLDIAMGLLMADRQWDTPGEFEYKKCALQTIDAMKRRNISSAGVTRGINHPEESRMSDQMLGHFKAFRAATGDVFWDVVYEKGLANLQYIQRVLAPNTGLIPDFLEQTNTDTPIPSRIGWGDPGNRPDWYYWNSCRVPMRLAAAYVTTGDERVQAVMVRFMDFFMTATSGKLINIREGYELDGTPVGTENIYWNPASYTATAAAGAMCDVKYQASLDDVCAAIIKKPATDYYDTELELLSLFVLGGNWWNPV
jgi:endoglucanase